MKKIFSLVLFIGLFSTRVRAAVFEGVNLDYGNLSDPFANIILPGSSGEVFVTLKNPSESAIKNIVLHSYRGSCVEDTNKEIRIDELKAKETLRIPVGIEIKISPTCKSQDIGSFLLLGSAENSFGAREQSWAEVKFVVAPPPVLEFKQENIGLFIPDVQTVEYSFTINNNLLIEAVGIYLFIEHSYIGDLGITLIHPNGTQVVLHNFTGGGSDNIDQFYGWGGASNFINLLNPFIGLSMQGTWILRIRDKESPDSGRLQKIIFRAKAKR